MVQIKIEDDIYWWTDHDWDGPFKKVRDFLNTNCVVPPGPKWDSRANASAFLAEKIVPASIIELEEPVTLDENVDY